MIDVHAYWKPAEVTDALRVRGKQSRILRNENSVKVLMASRKGETPVNNPFDVVDVHVDRKDCQRAAAAVLSLLVSFCWVESQSQEVSGAVS